MGRTASGNADPNHLALIRSLAEDAGGLELSARLGHHRVRGANDRRVERAVGRAVNRLVNGSSRSDAYELCQLDIGDGSHATLYKPDPWTIDTDHHENTIDVDMVHTDTGDRIKLQINIPHQEISSAEVSHGPPPGAEVKGFAINR